MKKQVVYIHGGESFHNHEDYLERLRTVDLWYLSTTSKEQPFKKWTSTLADDLGEEYEVIMPLMPNKQNALFSEWSIWFERHFDYLQDGTILIGCSLGAMFLAKYLSQNNLPFRPSVVILMAGAYKLPSFDDTDCGDFLVKPETVHPVVGKTDKLIIMHSKDDPVSPYEHGQALSNAVPEAEFVSFADKNHFLIEDFPELIAEIRKIST
jgi:predicted alpha/beta hydrolase family esterase